MWWKHTWKKCVHKKRQCNEEFLIFFVLLLSWHSFAHLSVCYTYFSHSTQLRVINDALESEYKLQFKNQKQQQNCFSKSRGNKKGGKKFFFISQVKTGLHLTDALHHQAGSNQLKAHFCSNTAQTSPRAISLHTFLVFFCIFDSLLLLLIMNFCEEVRKFLLKNSTKIKSRNLIRTRPLFHRKVFHQVLLLWFYGRMIVCGE